MRTTLLLGLLLSVLCAACDTAGIANLREKRDSLATCAAGAATSTWMRSVDGATEILVLGSEDPLELVPPEATNCYALAKVLYNSETSLETGSYAMDETHIAQFIHTDEYLFRFQPSLNVLSRDGSKRTTLETPALAMRPTRMDGATLVISFDGEEHRFTSIDDVIDRAKAEVFASATAEEGAEDIFRLFNLPLFTSQSRLLGFGSGRMTQYARITTPFNGLINGYFTVNVESPTAPTTHIDYYQMEELTGIVIDGKQDSVVGINAKGHMSGILPFVMVGGGGETMPSLRGSVDYGKLIIDNGIAGGGSYGLSIQGLSTSFTLPYTFANDIDLRRVLPIDTNP